MSEPEKVYLIGCADFSRFYIPDALHVMRKDERMLCADDETAAKLAELDGVKLIYGMEHVPDGAYVDTPENREIILERLEEYPEYKAVPIYGRILEQDEAPPDQGMCFGKG